MVTTAEWKTFLNDSVEERAVLYSTSQPSSSDFGCVTMTYSGENVNLNVFVSQGTILTNDVSVFQRQNIDTKMFATTSFQTPIAVPYMVRHVVSLSKKSIGVSLNLSDMKRCR